MPTLLGRFQGLSPRVRGNPGGVGSGCCVERSIPACAGEPALAVRLPWPSGVYPRVCGGTRGRFRLLRRFRGLSPRVRGNQPLRRLRKSRPGSIPACAGEPIHAYTGPNRRGVYPRVCGGTHHGAIVGQADDGLSPRVRGNRAGSGILAHSSGSIPACAGEPRRRLRRP